MLYDNAPRCQVGESCPLFFLHLAHMRIFIFIDEHMHVHQELPSEEYYERKNDFV